MKTVGVLAFQGGVKEHEAIIKRLGHRSLQIRSKKDLEPCDALIIPGGESTTISFFLEHTGLAEEIKNRASAGMPVFGTCAGAIILAKKITGDKVPPHLGLLDITVERNAYGRQIDSFHADLPVPKLKIPPIKTAFIRAPVIKKAGPAVQILATHGKNVVLVRQAKILAATFHPELRCDPGLHEYFLSQF